MPSLLQIARLSVEQILLPQTLHRTPEPSSIMDDDESVNQFNDIMKLNVAISLCGAIELLAKLDALSGKIALDVACGPGHFTLLLAKYGNFDKVVGIDLSESMLEKAQLNAEKAGLKDRVEFIRGDATALTQFRDQGFDLITCTNSAHHLPTHADLKTMLSEMGCCVSNDGVVMVMDLTRLKSAKCVEKYTKMMGSEYLARNSNRLYDDFCNSMHAAWTKNELRVAPNSVPSHDWYHFGIVPLAVNQFLVAYPKTKRNPSQAEAFTWPGGDPPIRQDLLPDYNRYRQALLTSWRFLRKTAGIEPL